jgi:hypothetical protein
MVVAPLGRSIENEARVHEHSASRQSTALCVGRVPQLEIQSGNLQEGRHGIERFRFGDIITDIVYDGKTGVAVQSNHAYTLVINIQNCSSFLRDAR